MGQLRTQAKALSAQVKEGDALAAKALLEHSVKLRHGNLAVRRFFLARGMGASIPDNAKLYCSSVLKNLSLDAVVKIAQEEYLKALTYKKRRKRDG